MKISREQVEQNRNRVLDTAAKLFRERGIDGIGIADLMKASGLTHGGFYRQFKSKDDFVVEAVKRAFGMTSADIRQRLAADASEPFEALVKHYVSSHHRDDPGMGCSLTALAADAARCDNPELKLFFGNIVSNYLDLLTAINPEADATEKRSTAIRILAEMVGAVLLSRVVPDEKLSDEILDVVSNDLLDRHQSLPRT
ncbi:TetR/AcrR family transcriptional regulator [Methylobacterium haplocladii]|uniref:TetR family transcriptional regulator n=1 Tax=Methylobacterium haplocladii TaxID=1176176 RepID=A0A512INC3_9HYPH|nr:TetR/AcrR family transcriptional regulator [Methylobacterium haplocladii]GEO99138.1 TetR family transcriptional regulator [Methylobacterium haplocladii]GJD83887.1 hypothetical protein HPGCJGGD_1761 [Methylobacterium haplocladii]GLS58538.1 TetR family transcriptional regulator [Methylobacterium haplocladii]